MGTAVTNLSKTPKTVFVSEGLCLTCCLGFVCVCRWYHIAHWSSKRMIRTLRAINLLNSVFLAFVGVRLLVFFAPMLHLTVPV